MGEASKLIKISKKYGIKGATVSVGRGTIMNPLLKFFAINEERRDIISMIVEKELAHDAIHGIAIEMKLNKPHHGIAFSYPVVDFIGKKNNIKVSNKNFGGKCMYSAIFVIVEKGKGEEVIDAANQVISTGGTIINARGAGVHEVQKFFSLEIEPEKEEVLIITKNKNQKKIVRSIRDRLKIDEPGNGILYVLDVKEVYGMRSSD